MLDKYRELMKAFIDNFYNDIGDDERLYVYDNLSGKAITLLNEDFREQIRELWYFDLILSWNKEENREKLKNISKCGFVYEYSCNEDKCKFINEHWDELDEIIKVLQDYVIEIEEEKKEKEEPANE